MLAAVGCVQNYPQYNFEENGPPSSKDYIQGVDYDCDIGLCWTR
jgi:hypothetical protein